MFLFLAFLASLLFNSLFCFMFILILFAYSSSCTLFIRGRTVFIVLKSLNHSREPSLWSIQSSQYSVGSRFNRGISLYGIRTVVPAVVRPSCRRVFLFMFPPSELWSTCQAKQGCCASQLIEWMFFEDNHAVIRLCCL